MRVLILGLGNPILGDDAVGIRVAESLRGLPWASNIEVDSACCGGLRLMERLIGYDVAVLVDAICSGAQPPGAIHHLTPGDLPTQHTASSHDATLPTAMRLAEALWLPVPRRIDIVAIEAERVLDFGEKLSPAVQAALPRARQAVLQILRQQGIPAPDFGGDAEIAGAPSSRVVPNAIA